MFPVNNLSIFMILDAFESSSIRTYYFAVTDVVTVIITSSMIYMFMNLFFFIFLRSQLTFLNTTRNIVFLGFKYVKATLYDVVATYFSYKYNIFFLFISYVYLYIFLNNFIGLIPFSNTINNHLNITGMISFVCWLGIILIGLKFFSTRLFSMFCVLGIPRALIPFLAGIEILSYIFRFISLSLRLFANIVAGHILLETIYVFLFKSTLSNNNNKVLSFVFMLLPSVFFILLILFEMVIAGLQSYIFIVLCLIYLKDSLYLH